MLPEKRISRIIAIGGVITGCVVALLILDRAVKAHPIKMVSSNNEVSQNVFPAEEKRNLSPAGKAEKNNYQSVKILFVGDIMADRYIREKIKNGGEDCFPFQKIKNFLGEYDSVIGNNEGPITSAQSVSQGTTEADPNHFRFTFPLDWPKCYQQSGIKVVSVGNNHILNFKSEGIDETLKALGENNIQFFGNPLDDNNLSVITKINGIRVGLVAYNQFGGASTEKILKAIGETKKNAQITVVYCHWGKEYEATPTKKQIDLGHQFVEAGADVVIGSHPHVIQNQEEYQGKKIYYSLGNFLFDQYFSDETKIGMVVEMDIDSKNQLSFKEYKIENKTTGQVELMAK